MKLRAKLGLVAAYAAVIMTIIVMASVPPVSRDALTHHLALPKLWLAQGGLKEQPDILFSYYPQLLDFLYVIPVQLQYDIAAKYIHFGFALLTALLVFLFVRRRLGAAWGALAGLMFLTIPVIVKLSVTAYVDLGLVFFGTAALLSLLMWLEDTGRHHWLLLAGLCMGLALHVKYNAMVFLVIFILLIPWFYLKRNHRNPSPGSAIAYTMGFALVALLVFSPWAIRNYQLTGNPVYPLHQSLFSPGETAPRESPVMDTQKRTLGPLAARRILHDESLPYILLIPLRIFFEGEDDNPRTFDGRLNPLLLLFPLLLLLHRRPTTVPRGEIALLSGYAILAILFTFLTTAMRIRYIAPVTPALVILSVYGLQSLNLFMKEKGLAGNMRQLVLAALAGAFLIPQLLYGADLFRKIDPLPYVNGRETRDQYISRHLGEYPLVQMSNRLVREDHRLLGLYLGNRRYYFDVDAVLDNSLLHQQAGQASSGSELAERLSTMQISHLLIRLDLFNQASATWDPETRQTLADFFRNHTRQLHTQNGYGLYEIRHQDRQNAPAD
ncbi:ArnT family glycosyltransferase [Thiolapillus sp.]